MPCPCQDSNPCFVQPAVHSLYRSHYPSKQYRKKNPKATLFFWERDFLNFMTQPTAWNKQGRCYVCGAVVEWYWQIKIKHSLYRPGQALGVPGVWGYQTSRKEAHESGKVASPSHPPGNNPETHFGYRLSRPQGHGASGRIKSMKNFDYHHRESKPRPSGL